MTQSKHVIVITGASRGLGYEMSKQLAEKSELAPYIIYATSRKGEETDIKAQFPDSEIRFIALDVGRSSQIDSLVKRIKEEGHPVSLLIVNGALADDTKGFTHAICKEMMDVNYRGCLEINQKMLPLMKKGSRIVNVSSSACQQDNLLLESYQRELINKPDLKIEEITKLMQEYEDGVPDKVPAGFAAPTLGHLYPIYTVTKVGMNLFTKVLARDHPDILINAFCPGANDTEMTRRNSPYFKGAKHPSEGARIGVHLAVDDIQGISGAYWANDTIFDKEVPQKPREWHAQGLDSAKEGYEH